MGGQGMRLQTVPIDPRLDYVITLSQDEVNALVAFIELVPHEERMTRLGNNRSDLIRQIFTALKANV